MPHFGHVYPPNIPCLALVGLRNNGISVPQRGHVTGRLRGYPILSMSHIRMGGRIRAMISVETIGIGLLTLPLKTIGMVPAIIPIAASRTYQKT